MRKILLVLLSISLLSSCKSYDFKESKLDNGLQMIVAKDEGLPLVNLTLMVKKGGSSDPVGKSGLGFMVSKLIDKSVGDKSAEKVAEDFALLGTEFSGRLSQDYMVFSTEALSSSAEDLLGLFYEVLTEAKFSPSEVSLFKKRQLAAIRQSYDDPDSFTEFVFSSYMMGSHPYGRPLSGRLQDVKSIGQEDIVGHFHSLVRPENSFLVVSGDVSKDLEAKIEKVFSAWQVENSGVVASAPSFKLQEDSPELRLVHRKDLEQSQIRLGQNGVPRNHKDYWALQVVNVVLGGNFSSRLMKELRVKSGLTYGARSSFEAGVYAGPFVVDTFTRNEKVGEAVSLALKVVTDFRTGGISKDELERAKNFLKGHLIRGFEDPTRLVQSVVRQRLYGLGPEEVLDVVKKVDAVDLDEANKAIQKHIDPDKMRILVYGPPSAIKQLRPIRALESRSHKEFY